MEAECGTINAVTTAATRNEAASIAIVTPGLVAATSAPPKAAPKIRLVF